MARRFPTVPGQTRTGGRYDRTHQKARAQAALRHNPTDPCARCRHPLGPMSRHLHYDHDEHGGYLGFSHANCNRRAGASKGGEVRKALYGAHRPAQPTSNPRRLAL